MTTTTQITGLLRDSDGTLEYLELPIINGEVCDKAGTPLTRTDETVELEGWGFTAARVYRNDGGREILLPDSGLELIDRAKKMGAEDRAAYRSEFGEDPVVGQVGDWDSTGWSEAWCNLTGESDLDAIEDTQVYSDLRIAYLSSLFDTDDVA